MRDQEAMLFTSKVESSCLIRELRLSLGWSVEQTFLPVFWPFFKGLVFVNNNFGSNNERKQLVVD